MSRKAHHIVVIIFCQVLISLNTWSQPTLASSTLIADQRIYGDLNKNNLFYYVPMGYRLVTDARGKPAFSLLRMRYTGTRAAGDFGTAKFNNLVQFHMTIDGSVRNKLAEVIKILRQTNPSAQLRVLPIRKFSSVLVFAGTGNNDSNDSVQLIKTSFSEATDEQSTDNNSYWNERTITIRLDNNDAQLVESALRKHQTLISFSYAIYTVFSEKDKNEYTFTGTASLVKQAKEYFDAEMHDPKDSALHLLMVKADVVDMNLDPALWPSIIQNVDINERVPAKYALFDVYCYDFNNQLRPDLYSKKIDIKATSVNGSDVITSFSFKQSQPDLCARSIRFQYAVRFDRPFYYRVTEVSIDGDLSSGEWIERRDWSPILDITSTPDKVIAKPITEDQ